MVEERPLICPKCKTARWNKPKKKLNFLVKKTPAYAMVHFWGKI